MHQCQASLMEVYKAATLCLVTTSPALHREIDIDQGRLEAGKELMERSCFLLKIPCSCIVG